LRKLFDITIGVYSYTDLNGIIEREYIITLFIIFYIFNANILILNVLIAILSSAYEAMLESGSFKFKVKLFEYCESYITAFYEVDRKGGDGLGELVIHPPIISCLCFFLVPFAFFNYKGKKMALYFSYVIFWIENFFLIIIFLIFDLTLIPLAYFITFYNIS